MCTGDIRTIHEVINDGFFALFLSIRLTKRRHFVVHWFVPEGEIPAEMRSVDMKDELDILNIQLNECRFEVLKQIRSTTCSSCSYVDFDAHSPVFFTGTGIFQTETMSKNSNIDVT